MCTHPEIHTHTHTHTHTFLHPHKHTHTHTLSHTHTHTHTHTLSLSLSLSLIYAHTDTFMHARARTHTHARVRIHILFCLSLSHTHTHTLILRNLQSAIYMCSGTCECVHVYARFNFMDICDLKLRHRYTYVLELKYRVYTYFYHSLYLLHTGEAALPMQYTRMSTLNSASSNMCSYGFDFWVFTTHHSYYGVALLGGIDTHIGLFCKRAP